MSDDISAFFGSGYSEKPKKPKEEKFVDTCSILEEMGVWPVASEWANVAINVMGNVYEGKDIIQIIAGDIIVDGVKKDKMPITSGTWFKVLKGEQKKINNILTISS